MDKILAARRAGRVQRFHTYDTLRREDVAQHTFNVMNLLLILTNCNVSKNLIIAALMHDQGEYVTGDIPSPVKLMLKSEPLLNMEVAAVNFIHHQGGPHLTEWEQKLLKLADNLDGYIKASEEVAMGNMDLKDAKATYLLYLDSMVRHFMGGDIWARATDIMRHYNV